MNLKIWMRRLAWSLLALALLAAALVAGGLALSHWRAQRTMSVVVAAVPVRSDAAALERGRYLFNSRGCADCHGARGTGRSFVDDAKSGIHLAGPNITVGGERSATTRYQPVDWVRAIRHGLDPRGRMLRVMPSEDYNRLTDADLGALIGHLQSLPAAAGGAAVVELPLPARVMHGFGQVPAAAERIDHRRPAQAPVPEGVTLEHGRYVAQMCIGCHGAQLEGGRVPGSPPDWPAAPRIAPGAGSVVTARYADAQAFLRMFKSGQRADGSAIAVMPFEALAQMSDTDARALHLYLLGSAR